VHLIFWHAFDVEQTAIVDFEHEQDIFHALGFGVQVQFDRDFKLVICRTFLGIQV